VSSKTDSRAKNPIEALRRPNEHLQSDKEGGGTSFGCHCLGPGVLLSASLRILFFPLSLRLTVFITLSSDYQEEWPYPTHLIYNPSYLHVLHPHAQLRLPPASLNCHYGVLGEREDWHALGQVLFFSNYL
jgi:hypothetical protein